MGKPNLMWLFTVKEMYRTATAMCPSRFKALKMLCQLRYFYALIDYFKAKTGGDDEH